MNVNNSKLLLFIPAILEHVSRNRTCSIGKLRTHNKKHVITEPSKTPGLPSELDLSDSDPGLSGLAVFALSAELLTLSTCRGFNKSIPVPAV